MDIEIMPNTMISIELPWFWNSIFCKNKSLTLQSTAQSDKFRAWWTASLEMYLFCSSYQKPDSQIFFKKCAIHDDFIDT